MGSSRHLTIGLGIALAVAVTSTLTAPSPAVAECPSPDAWPLFREGAPSASLVVTGTVRSVQHDPRSEERVSRFVLDVDRELRGSAIDRLPLSGVRTARGCIPSDLRVFPGDRIVVAFGPARTGVETYVASVAFLSRVRSRNAMDRMLRMSMRHIRQTLALSTSDLVLFTAQDGRHGRELWRTDGTQEGTRLVRDIRRRGSSDPRDLTVADGLLWFSADDGVHGRELWVSDGTAAGTHLVADLLPGAGPSNPRWLVAYGYGVAFGADDGIHGRELWTWNRADGRARLLRNLRPDDNVTPGSDPRWLLEANGSLYLTADDGVHGRELRRVDPYDRPSTTLIDQRPGPIGSRPEQLMELASRRRGGPVYFSASNGVHGRELFLQDWQAGGLVADLHPGPDGSDPTELTGPTRLLYLVADDGQSGPQLWRALPAPATDGSPPPSIDDGVIRLTRLAGPEPGVTGPPARALVPLPGDQVAFAAEDAGDGGQLWISDGTVDGTKPLTSAGGGLAAYAGVRVQGRAFFATGGPGADGRELWITDGTVEGTRAVADIHPRGDAHPTDLVSYHGHAVFVADDGRTGREPWISSGRAAGTRRILDVRPGPPGSLPRELTPLVSPRYRYDSGR